MLPKINIPKSEAGLEAINSSHSKENSSNDQGDSEERKPKLHPFESLSEEGKRYLQEYLGLPSIDPSAGKRYVNPHPTESIMSSSEGWENWWDLEEFEDFEDCCIHRKDMKIKRTTEKEEEDYVQEHERRRYYPLTKAVGRERRLKEKQTQESRKAKIVSDLEKRMVSLYILKVSSSSDDRLCPTLYLLISWSMCAFFSAAPFILMLDIASIYFWFRVCVNVFKLPFMGD